MAKATTMAHWGKPIWLTEGGAELPVLNLAFSMALMIREPDKYSLDRLLGLRLPTWVGPLGLAGILLTMRYTGVGTEEQQQEKEEEGAQDEVHVELAGEES